jgi:uncharacterized protein CbrC (UPF0167 family)
MNWLMLSCKKATELIEKKLLVKLSFKEKIQLEMHKSICNACTAYEKQSKKMDELFHNHFQNIDATQPEATINEGIKKRIIDTLSEN